MNDLNIVDLQALLIQARAGVQYAWDHYDELVNRVHTYTLYGPYAPWIGACIPSRLCRKSDRKLSTKTRRQNYNVYELDAEYRVLRTISVRDYNEVECVYHHFELNNLIYAYPFRGTEKAMFTDEIIVLSPLEGEPQYLGIARRNYLCAQFYQPISDKKMILTDYVYNPNATHSFFGYPTDKNAPVNAPNSLATKVCSEQEREYIEFSRWFKQGN